MKYTDKEYRQQLEDLNDIIDALQTSDQCVFKDRLDNAMTDLQNEINDYLEVKQ